MMMFDPDVYFDEKLKEYYHQYLNDIIPRIENSRKKAITLEKIREENEEARVMLYKFTYNDKQLSDSFRYHVIEKFKKTYEENQNYPVKVFIENVFPKIRKEDEEDFNRYINEKGRYRYDIQYLKNASLEEIIELSTKSLFLRQAWFQISAFLCVLYKEDENNLARILYYGYDDLSVSYFYEQILEEFPDLRNNLSEIFKLTKSKLSRTISSEPLILNVPLEKEDAFINKLYSLLHEKQFIEVGKEAFKAHFKSDSFEKIRWKKSKVQLAYLIFELRLRNENIHEVTVNHFLDKDGKEFVNNFSSIRLQMKSNYIEIDKILEQLKTI